MRVRFDHRARKFAEVALLAVAGVGIGAAADVPVPGRGDQGPVHGAPEEEPAIAELSVAPPAYPRNSNLVEFKLRGQTTNRFFIDSSSLSVGKDHVIRFVLLIRTASEDTNVRFSGLRCKEREWKDYASAASDHTWKVATDAQWKNVQDLQYNNYQYTLHKDYFCVGGGWLSTTPAGDAVKLVKLLKNPPQKDPRVPTYRNGQ